MRTKHVEVMCYFYVGQVNEGAMGCVDAIGSPHCRKWKTRSMSSLAPSGMPVRCRGATACKCMPWDPKRVPGGSAAVFKLRNLRHSISCCISHEIEMYAAVEQLQGEVQRAVAAGINRDGTAIVLATEYIPEATCLDVRNPVHAASHSAVEACVLQLHACGVVHGDLARRNFLVQARTSSVWQDDLGGCAVLHRQGKKES